MTIVIDEVMSTIVFSVASGTFRNSVPFGQSGAPDSDQDVAGEERPEQHHLRGQEEPDADLAVGEARIGTDVNCVGNLHRLNQASNWAVKSFLAPGTLYSYGPRCASGTTAKLPCGGGEGAAHSIVVASQGLSPTGFPVLDAPEEIDDERDLEDGEDPRAPRGDDVEVQHRLRKVVARAPVEQAPRDAGHAQEEHRHEDEIHADERAEEMDLAERLVHHPPGRLRDTSSRPPRRGRRSFQARRRSGSGR